jgi:hypothetical protein
MYRLIIQNGRRRGRRLNIRSKRALVGSAEDCTVRVAEMDLAERHAELFETETGVYLRRLEAGNRTAINGVEVEHAVLHDGDSIAIGSASFKFQSPSDPRGCARRRGDFVQFITIAAVLALLLVEIGLLFGWTIYLTLERQKIVPAEEIRAEPALPAEPVPAEEEEAPAIEPPPREEAPAIEPEPEAENAAAEEEIDEEQPEENGDAEADPLFEEVKEEDSAEEKIGDSPAIMEEQPEENGDAHGDAAI